MKVEVAVLGSPSLTALMVSVDVKVIELRSCVKVEVGRLGFVSLTVLMLSVDIKQHSTATQYYLPVVTDDGTTRVASTCLALTNYVGNSWFPPGSDF